MKILLNGICSILGATEENTNEHDNIVIETIQNDREKLTENQLHTHFQIGIQEN